MQQIARRPNVKSIDYSKKKKTPNVPHIFKEPISNSVKLKFWVSLQQQEKRFLSTLYYAIFNYCDLIHFNSTLLILTMNSFVSTCIVVFFLVAMMLITASEARPKIMNPTFVDYQIDDSAQDLCAFLNVC